MSDTPRTDAELPVYHGFPSTVSREFARTLERELSAQEVQMNAVRYRAEKAERELAAAQSDLARLAQSNAAQAAETERLTKWCNDLQSGMYVNCVYCGHRYGPHETTPVSMADALKAHVERCPQHPMSALKAENERLRDILEMVVSLAAQEWCTDTARYSAKGSDGKLFWFITEDLYQAARRALSNEGE